MKKSPNLIQSIVYRGYYHYFFKFGSEIAPRTQIGVGLRIPHWDNGNVIHANTQVVLIAKLCITI